MGYEAIVTQLLGAIEPQFGAVSVQRLHGDAHLGNLIWQGGYANLLSISTIWARVRWCKISG